MTEPVNYYRPALAQEEVALKEEQNVKSEVLRLSGVVNCLYEAVIELRKRLQPVYVTPPSRPCEGKAESAELSDVELMISEQTAKLSTSTDIIIDLLSGLRI